MKTHWFWLILTLACLLWYSVITLFVAVKATSDIKTMLRTLGKAKSRAETEGHQP